MAYDTDGLAPQAVLQRRPMSVDQDEDEGLIPQLGAVRGNQPVVRPAPGTGRAGIIGPTNANPNPPSPVGDTRPNDVPHSEDPEGLVPQAPPTSAISQVPVPRSDEFTGTGPLRHYTQAIENLGPRPTDANKVPGAHHGFRKVLDVLGGVALGVGTMNPFAGMGMYKMLHDAPLRKAQSGYDANLEANEDAFKKEKELLAAHDTDEYRKTQQEHMEAVTNKLNNAVDPNSIFQDENGDFHGKTYGGETVPVTPKGFQKPSAGDVATEKQKALVAQREQIAEAVHLKKGSPEWQHYVATGTFREPNPGHTKSMDELWVETFTKENGRPPTAEEIANRHKTAAPLYKDQNALDNHFQQQYQKQESEYQRRRDEILKRYRVAEDPKNNYKDAEPEIQALDQWNEGEKNKLGQLKKNEESRLPHLGGNQQAPPAHHGNQPKSAHKVGDVVHYQGKSYKVTGIRPSGELELGPAQ